jgi:hypothetical protein
MALGNKPQHAGDQILTVAPADELQTTAYHINLSARKYKMNISRTEKNQWQCVETTHKE